MLKAGFSRLDVTPPLGTPVPGYFEERFAKGILDPLELNALAFSDGEKTAVIVVADFLGIMEEFATPIRKMVSEKTGVPEQNIMISATHSHTSLRLGCAPWTASVEDKDYLSVLYRKFVDAAVLAIADMKEATLSTAAEETPMQLSFIRRYKMKDGSTVTNPGRCNPEIDHPIGNADNTVRLLRFSRKGAKDIALVNFSTHPDTIAGELISADWPGFIRRFTEKDLGVHCLTLVGAQGDTNHVDTRIPEKHTGYKYTELIGFTVASTVKRMWNNTVFHADNKVFSEVEIVVTKSNRDGEDEKDKYVKIYENYLKTGEEPKEGISVLGKAYRLYNIDTLPPELKIPVTVMGIGDVAIVGFGGEPFSEYAEKTRAAAPDSFVINACCSNGQQGYLPSPGAFAEGGYEAGSSRFTPKMPVEVVNAAERMLKKYVK